MAYLVYHCSFGLEVPGTKVKVGNPELIFFCLYRDSTALAFTSSTWPGRGSLAVYRPGSMTVDVRYNLVFCCCLFVCFLGEGVYFQKRRQSWLVPEAGLAVLFI